MKVFEIYNLIDSFSPFNTAEDWDNVGLLLGKGEDEISGILVCLDATKEAVSYAVKNNLNLIITHHPVIFDPIKSIDYNSVISTLIANKINVISAHTNLDKSEFGVNKELLNALNLKNEVLLPDGFGYVGELPAEMDIAEFINHVKSALSLNKVRFTKGLKPIKKVGLLGGSGGDALYDAANLGADAFVTGDVKHSIFVKALELGITLVDGTHFSTENIIISPLAQKIKEVFNNTHAFTDNFISEV